jgi:hypothetical protein
MLTGITAQIHSQRDGEAEEGQRYEQKEQVEKLVVVQSNGIVHEGAIVVKKEDTFPANMAVF